MSDIKVNLKLDGSDFSLTAKQAQDAIDDLTDKLKKLKGPLGDASGVISSFGGKLGDAAKGIAAVTAGLAAAAAAAAGYGLAKAIEGAIEAEQAFNAVANSLRLSGELSEDALKDVEKFAAELQDLTGLGDDTTYSMLAVAQSFGLTKDEAKKVVAAANDMSVATGKDLKTSVETLSKSFNGSAKELSKLNPQIKEFTAEQLAAGAAVEAIGKQYRGTAAKRLETFGGAVSALKGRFGDLLEEIGFLITKNPAVVSTIREVEKGVKALSEIISNNAETIRRWITGAISDFLNGLSLSVRALGLFGESVDQVESLEMPDIFTKAGKAVAFLVDQFLAAKETFARLKFEFESNRIQEAINFGIVIPQEGFDNLQRLKDNLDEVKKARDDLATAVAQADGLKFEAPDTSPFAKAIDKIKAKIDTLPSTVSIDFKTGGGGGGGVDRPDGKTVKGDGAKQGPSVMDASDAVRVLRGLGLKFKPIDPKEVGPPEPPPAKDPGGFRNPFKGDREDLKGTWQQVGIDIAQSLVDNIKNGMEGAKTFIATSLAAIGDRFLPGIGKLLGPFFQALSDGPEAIKGYIKAFNEAIPQVVENIITALPALTESIFEQGPKIIERLAERAPEIITALIKASPAMVKAIVMNLSDYRIWLGVGEALLQSMVEGFNYNKEKQKEAVQQFKDGVGQASRNFVSGVTQIGPMIKMWADKAVASFSTFITELPNKVGQGFEAVLAFFKEALGAVLEGFLKGLGEGFEGIWKGFKSAAEALPADFAARFSEVFGAIFAEAGSALSKLFNGLGSILAGAFGGLPDALKGMWVSVRDALGRALKDGLLYLPEQLANALAEGLKGLAGDLGNVSTGGKVGGKGGLDGNPATPLATGGMVRGLGNRDTVPALLSPGELVVDRTTGPRLNAFLDKAEGGLSQSSGSSDPTTLALLAKVVDLLQKPFTVETEATVDGRTLADIILKLNRTNQRLA